MEYVFIFPIIKKREMDIEFEEYTYKRYGVNWIIPAQYIKQLDYIVIYLGVFLGEVGDFVGETFFGYITFLISHEHMHRVLYKIGEDVEYKKEEKMINHLDFLSGLRGDKIRKIYIKNGYKIIDTTKLK